MIDITKHEFYERFRHDGKRGEQFIIYNAVCTVFYHCMCEAYHSKDISIFIDDDDNFEPIQNCLVGLYNKENL
jgi:hypothetical protein